MCTYNEPEPCNVLELCKPRAQIKHVNSVVPYRSDP